MYKILIADKSEKYRKYLKSLACFRHNGRKYEIVCEAGSGAQVLEQVDSMDIDIIILERTLGAYTGKEILKIIKNAGFQGCVIMMSKEVSFDYAKEAFLNGAFDCLSKPVDNSVLAETLDRAYEYLAGTTEKKFKLKEDIINGMQEGIIGGKPEAARVYAKLAIGEVEKYSTEVFEQKQLYQRILKRIGSNIESENKLEIQYISIDSIYTQIKGTKPDQEFLNRVEFLAREFREMQIESSNQNVNKAWFYILEHSGEDISLRILADALYMNRSYLGTLLKKELGIGLSEILLRVRMKRAVVLMGKKEMRLCDISWQLGYKDPSYFSKAFKKELGEEPSIYRKRLLGA